MKIVDIMSKPAIVCRLEDNLDSAAGLMWRHDCGAIAVIDSEARLAGIVTDRDICMAAYTQGKRLADIPVSTAMARDVQACSPDDSIEAAESVMQDIAVRRIPVVDADRHPVGVVSLNDIARAASDERAGSRLQRELVQTLSAVCRPRVAAAE